MTASMPPPRHLPGTPLEDDQATAKAETYDPGHDYPANQANNLHPNYSDAAQMSAMPGTYTRKATVGEVFKDYEHASTGQVPTIHAHIDAQPGNPNRHIDPRKPTRKVTQVLDGRIEELSDKLTQLRALRTRLEASDLTMDDLRSALER